MAKVTKAEEAEMKAEYEINKKRRLNYLSRVMYLVLLIGSMGSTIILLMLLSENDISNSTNVVAVLNGLAGAYFTFHLILDK